MNKVLKSIGDRYFGENVNVDIKRLNTFGIAGLVVSSLNVITLILQRKPLTAILISLCLVLGTLFMLTYTNHIKYCKKGPFIISGILNFIGFPMLFLLTKEHVSNIALYYVFGIVLTFMIIRGKQLLYMISLEIIVYALTYIIKFHSLSETAQVAAKSSYISSFIAMLIVSIAIGAEVYMQTTLYIKKEEENKKQHNMLEEYIMNLDIARREADAAKQEEILANKAKSEFLATMSHEIRTPMNAVLGMSEIILKEENVDTEIREKTESIHRAAKSLLVIINDILDLSKIESGKMELINVKYQPSSLFNDVINMIRFRLEEKPIELIVNIDHSMPCELYGDEVRMRQVLINILNNAVKYTNSGTIHLNASWKMKDGKALITISVKDTGMGIKKEEIHKLFTSFERLDKKKNYALEGSGLGLKICKQILDLMGGTIHVESEYGQGSEFTIVVEQKIINRQPIQKINYRSVENTVKQVSFIAPKANILIVDDNAVNLKVAKGLMASYKFNIDTAISGEECLALMSRKHYDLIFMDHMMPHLDGIDTMRLIRENEVKYKDVPAVVALTANAIAGVKELFKKEGFCDYVSKPIEVHRLERVLLRHLPSYLIQYTSSKEYEEAQVLPFTIEEIDTEIGMHHVEGKVGVYIDLLKTYCRETKRLNSNLDKLIDEDLEMFIINIHSIKGSSRSIGALEVAKFAETLELAARTDNIEYVKKRISECMDYTSSVVEDISVKLQEYEKQKIVEEKEERKVLDQAVLIDLKMAFNDFDLEAIERNMSLLNKYNYPKKIESFVEEIMMCSEDLDYEMGSQKVEEYLANI